MRNFKDFIARKMDQYGKQFNPEDLNPSFVKYFESGERITVDFGYEKKRGTIGVTTGWKPCFLLMARIDSRGSSYTIGKNDKVSN
jgi:hypothetical protein